MSHAHASAGDWDVFHLKAGSHVDFDEIFRIQVVSVHPHEVTLGFCRHPCKHDASLSPPDVVARSSGDAWSFYTSVGGQRYLLLRFRERQRLQFDDCLGVFAENVQGDCVRLTRLPDARYQRHTQRWAHRIRFADVTYITTIPGLGDPTGPDHLRVGRSAHPNTLSDALRSMSERDAGNRRT